MRGGAYGKGVPKNSSHTRETELLSSSTQARGGFRSTRRDKQETEVENGGGEEELDELDFKLLTVLSASCPALVPCSLCQQINLACSHSLNPITGGKI